MYAIIRLGSYSTNKNNLFLSYQYIGIRKDTHYYTRSYVLFWSFKQAPASIGAIQVLLLTLTVAQKTRWILGYRYQL